MWTDIRVAVKRFVLLTEFHFLVEICLRLGCIIISNSLILGSYSDCTHGRDKIDETVSCCAYRHPLVSGALRWMPLRWA